MNTKAIDIATGEEHLRDGQDNIKECVKTLQRVQKSFPKFAAELTRSIETLGKVRSDIASVAERLQRD